MRNIIKKKKCLLFKQEKNNQTVSNDWPNLQRFWCLGGISPKIWHAYPLQRDICIFGFAFFTLVCPLPPNFDDVPRSCCILIKKMCFQMKMMVFNVHETPFLCQRIRQGTNVFLFTCVKFHGKKIDNNDTLTHICLLPFFQMALYYVT